MISFIDLISFGGLLQVFYDGTVTRNQLQSACSYLSQIQYWSSRMISLKKIIQVYVWRKQGWWSIYNWLVEPGVDWPVGILAWGVAAVPGAGQWGGLECERRDVLVQRALRGGRLREPEFLPTRRKVFWHFNNLVHLSVRVRKRWVFFFNPISLTHVSCCVFLNRKCGEVTCCKLHITHNCFSSVNPRKCAVYKNMKAGL